MMILDIVGHKLDQLSEMASRAQIDFAKAPPHSLENEMRRAVWRCMFCRHAQQCRDWLDEAEADSDFPDFCPNADIFRRHRQ